MHHRKKKNRKEQPSRSPSPKVTQHVMFTYVVKYVNTVHNMQNINLIYIDSKGLFLRESVNSQSSTTYSTLQHRLHAHAGDLWSSDQLKVDRLFQQNVYLCFCVLLY